MNEKKQEELEKMYALRAGLSVISQKSDELACDDESVRKMKDDVAQLKKPKYEGKSKYDVDREIEEEDESANHVISALAGKLLNLCDGLKASSGGLHFPFLRNGVEKMHDAIWDFSDNFAADAMAIALAIVVIGHILIVLPAIPLIVLDIITFPFRLFSPKRAKAKKFLKEIMQDENYDKISKLADRSKGETLSVDMIEKVVGLLESLEYEFSDLDKKLISKSNVSSTAIIHLQKNYGKAAVANREEGYKEVERQKEEYREQCKEFEKYQKERQIQCDKKIQNNKQLSLVLSKESQAITDVLKSSYSSVLDIRDWENLDLVIYYYETGRADSVKEALQLVDMERRNDNLMSCIAQANQEICSTIRENFNELGRVMISGFQSLSTQIETQRIQTINALSELDRNVKGAFGEMSSTLSKSVTQQQLSNALLAKANVSSKQMVEQMKQLNGKIKNK